MALASDLCAMITSICSEVRPAKNMFPNFFFLIEQSKSTISQISYATLLISNQKFHKYCKELYRIRRFIFEI